MPNIKRDHSTAKVSSSLRMRCGESLHARRYFLRLCQIDYYGACFKPQKRSRGLTLQQYICHLLVTLHPKKCTFFPSSSALYIQFQKDETVLLNLPPKGNGSDILAASIYDGRFYKKIFQGRQP